VVEGEDRFFDDKTIFDYIDGSGEVYRATTCANAVTGVLEEAGSLSFSMCSTWAPLQMPSASSRRHGREAVAIARMVAASGWLNFWKDRYFVSITVQEENPQALRLPWNWAGRLAPASCKRSAAEAAGTPAQRGLQARTIRFLHHPIVLTIISISPTKDPGTLACDRRGVGDLPQSSRQRTPAARSYPMRRARRPRKISAALPPDADADGITRLETTGGHRPG